MASEECSLNLVDNLRFNVADATNLFAPPPIPNFNYPTMISFDGMQMAAGNDFATSTHSRRQTYRSQFPPHRLSFKHAKVLSARSAASNSSLNTLVSSYSSSGTYSHPFKCTVVEEGDRTRTRRQQHQYAAEEPPNHSNLQSVEGSRSDESIRMNSSTHHARVTVNVGKCLVWTDLTFEPQVFLNLSNKLTHSIISRIPSKNCISSIGSLATIFIRMNRKLF